MSRFFAIETILFVSVAALSVTVACHRRSPFVDTPISGAIVIDSASREIIFEKPFKPTKQVSKICFEYTDPLSVYDIAKAPQFGDGTNLRLEAKIVDRNGKSYDLDDIENSVDYYICLVPGSKDWLDISKTDTAFVKLIVRSNRPIHLSKIEWVAYNSWDI